MKIFYVDIDSGETNLKTSFKFEEQEEIYNVLSFEGVLLKSDDTYFLSGSIKAEVECACDRCLTPLTINIDTDVAVAVEPGKLKNAAKSEYEIQDQDGDIYCTDPEFIDLHDILRQELLLQAPVKRICASGCEPAYIEENKHEDVSTPFSKLEKLKERLKEK